MLHFSVPFWPTSEPGGPDTPIKLDKQESEISVFTDEEEGPQTPRDLSSATQKPPTSTPSPLAVENLSQSTPDNETLYKRREVAVSISLENIADKRWVSHRALWSNLSLIVSPPLCV